jgi:MFS family permease
MSGLLTGHAFTAQFPEIDTTAGAGGSASLQGTVVAIYEIGCFFGAIIAFLIGEKIGRRKTIMLGCIILCIGGALQACAYGIPHMIVGRIVAGVGNGLNTSTIRRFRHRGRWCIANISSCVALGTHAGRCPRQGCKSDQRTIVRHG